jgi:hypothetical protein
LSSSWRRHRVAREPGGGGARIADGAEQDRQQQIVCGQRAKHDIHVRSPGRARSSPRRRIETESPCGVKSAIVGFAVARTIRDVRTALAATQTPRPVNQGTRDAAYAASATMSPLLKFATAAFIRSVLRVPCCMS